MNSKKLAALVALAISAGLTGCAAQPDVADEATEGEDQAVAAPADESTAVASNEKTGEAAEKCGFGWGGFGGCGGFGWGGFGWGGIGFGGCGFGWGGFAWGGFGWGGFGGCGCGGFGGCW